ncbi:hypothetical protein D3C77_524350 [compost metagenome]
MCSVLDDNVAGDVAVGDGQKCPGIVMHFEEIAVTGNHGRAVAQGNVSFRNGGLRVADINGATAAGYQLAASDIEGRGVVQCAYPVGSNGDGMAFTVKHRACHAGCASQDMQGHSRGVLGEATRIARVGCSNPAAGKVHGAAVVEDAASCCTDGGALGVKGRAVEQGDSRANRRGVSGLAAWAQGEGGAIAHVPEFDRVVFFNDGLRVRAVQPCGKCSRHRAGEQ